MKRSWTAWLGIAALVLSAASAHARSKSASFDDPDFEYRWKLKDGQVIEVSGVNGSIQAERSKGSYVEVVATKRATKSDPDEVRIEAVEHKGGVMVCAVYPGPGNSCEPGHHESRTRNNDVVVDFRVLVPEGVKLKVHTVNGGVDVEDVESDVEAHTVNGSVHVTTSGTAIATTVNGSVSASIGSSSWGEQLKFETVNGAITVRFPADLEAMVDASTENGDITTDFPLTVHGKIGRRHLSGRIGRGDGGELALSTVNGSIRLLTEH
jgi:hypothetical protein